MIEPPDNAANAASRASSAIAGLDDVLAGGFTPARLYLVEGMPGSGKTTLAFQFLLEGVRNGEPVLYLALSETEEEIREVAESHGWDLAGVVIRELLPAQETLEPGEQYTVFHPTEVELSDTTKRILADVEETKPQRVVFDSLSELRLLAGSPLRYRRQILALKRFFAGHQCTVMLLDDLTSSEHDLQVQSIAHGSLLLQHSVPAFGGVRRRLRVTKYRGSDFRAGDHDYVIRRGGLSVFPRLVVGEHAPAVSRRLSSGIEELDLLLGGGLECGSSALLQGAAGTGKSTLAALFCARAAAEGVHSAMFVFDERPATLFNRMRDMHIPLREYVDAGSVQVQQVDPAELSPGEFAQCIRRSVEADNARVVVIDSLNGYFNAMPDERLLQVHLHELLTFLGQHGVATVMCAAHRGIFGAHAETPMDASYLADAILLLRYFELDGEVRQAISVLKMRGAAHERTIREFSMKGGKVSVSAPLRGFRGVLTGIPEIREFR